ncbi:hypothetical protein, partial [Pseudomonas gingeri]
LHPPEKRSEGVNLIQDGTGEIKKPLSSSGDRGFFIEAEIVIASKPAPTRIRYGDTSAVNAKL